ncbi:hypothetical protein DH09_01555 [Bacillaceae bacterium JMAK1]|nr:hypothetical protein DH09_01555 [Bacillaceae bacterium JMAK1]
MGHPNCIVQIVGYKNAGKTTTIAKLVTALEQRNVSTAVIKHHGHSFSPPKARYDSEHFIEAGAKASLVEGGGEVSIQLKKEMTLEQLLHLQSSISNVDVVFVEGFKDIQLPNIVLLRDEDDFSLLDRSQTIGVIQHHRLLVDCKETAIFLRDEEEMWISYFVNQIVEMRSEHV